MYKFVNRPKSICPILGLVFLKIIFLGCGKPPRPNPPLAANKIRTENIRNKVDMKCIEIIF